MRTLILALALLLAAPVTASAAGGLKPIAPGSGLKPVPPSNSAANQYVEVVPTAGGGTPATGITRRSSGSGPASASALPAQTRVALAGSGQDGQRVAQLTQATAPARVRTHGKTRKHAGAVVGSSRGSSGGGSSGSGSSGSGSTAATPVSSVVKSLTGGGASGIGAGLPVALILVALGISGVALARRRAA